MSAPTMILREAMILAAARANGGNGGNEGLVNYLQTQAEERPTAFMVALSRVIPLQVEAKGDNHITIEIIKNFDNAGDSAKLINGANGFSNGHGHKDTPSE